MPARALDRGGQVRDWTVFYRDTYVVVYGENVPGVGIAEPGDTPIGAAQLERIALSARAPRAPQMAATLHLELPAPADVELKIIDVAGRTVATVFRASTAAGPRAGQSSDVRMASFGRYLIGSALLTL